VFSCEGEGVCVLVDGKWRSAAAATTTAAGVRERENETGKDLFLYGETGKNKKRPKAKNRTARGTKPASRSSKSEAKKDTQQKRSEQ